MHRANRRHAALFSTEGSEPLLETLSGEPPEGVPPPARTRLSLGLRIVAWIFPTLLVLVVIGFFVARHFVRKAMSEALPQIDGTVFVPGAAPPLFGLHAAVTVSRDGHGVPHIHAGSVDDLVYAQGYVTAQDRLWQMDLLRRHAAGELAAVLGPELVEHDRLQRTLQIREAAERALAVLPADQKHVLEVYARGVNASIIVQRNHLPLEFRVLQFTPGAWTPRDSLLIALVMYQDLSTGFPTKLGRESLAAHLPAELVNDLYPTGSWRDHYPGQAVPDLTTEQPEFEEIPLDESQSRLQRPEVRSPEVRGAVAAESLIALEKTLSLFHAPCTECVAGSNSWAVAGARTASGKPLLSDDMHLNLTIPTLWYEADLSADTNGGSPAFHVAGVTLPGTPFVIAGHNDHVAWGFTNLGGDVQDLYIEHTRGTPGGAEYQALDGSWKPVGYRRELIHVRGAADVVLDVPLVGHSGVDLPVISSIFPGEKRTISLRWSAYDPNNVSDPFFAVNSATDWHSMLAAFSGFGGPTQNMVYADDQGHIGYHAVGRIPIRGDDAHPSPLSPVPTDTQAADAAAHEWSGYVPFDAMPQAFDPADGVIATANGKVMPDSYGFPITLDWMAPYRTERIYKLLETSPGHRTEQRRGMTAKDMLAVETDVYSEEDHIFAQKLAYAIDHASGALAKDKELKQAADLLRAWNGEVKAASSAAAIISASRQAFWPMLLVPHLAPQLAPAMMKSAVLPANAPADQLQAASVAGLYVWGEKYSVEEQLLTHQPERWLPAGYKDWDDFLATVVQVGLRDAHAPSDLKKWSEGKAYPLVLQHPIFSRSALLAALIGRPTGPGTQPQDGDRTTIRQVGTTFGPSERLTVDLGNLDNTTLNIVTGESGNLSSPWYMDQFTAWLGGRTFAFPFSAGAVGPTVQHTLTLEPH